MTRLSYAKPRINSVILFPPDVDPEDALRAARQPRQPQQPDPATMHKFFLVPPEPPEIHYLCGGYPDGRENRRERRRRERATKKNR